MSLSETGRYTSACRRGPSSLDIVGAFRSNGRWKGSFQLRQMELVATGDRPRLFQLSRAVLVRMSDARLVAAQRCSGFSMHRQAGSLQAARQTPAADGGMAASRRSGAHMEAGKARPPCGCGPPVCCLRLELEIRERPDSDARQQHLVLVEGDGIADVLVQQVVADQAHMHLARAEPALMELRPIADLGP